MGERYGRDTDLAAIDKVRDDHVAALNAGNAEDWVAQFAEDGVQMPPNAPANIGKAMIGAWSRGLLGQFQVTFGLTVDEVRVLGDWAFERGGYAIHLASDGGPAMDDAGKYITIYRKEDGGGWQMARDIWNSDAPPPQV